MESIPPNHIRYIQKSEVVLKMCITKAICAPLHELEGSDWTMVVLVVVVMLPSELDQRLWHTEGQGAIQVGVLEDQVRRGEVLQGDHHEETH